VRPLRRSGAGVVSLKARQHTTTFGDARCDGHCCVHHGAGGRPSAGCTRLKKLSSPMPTLRAMSISSLESIVNVTMPSTSLGASPLVDAVLTASQATCISLRPDSLEARSGQCDDGRGAGANHSMLRPFSKASVDQAEDRGPIRDRQAVGRLEGYLDEALLIPRPAIFRSPLPVNRSDRSGSRPPRRIDNFLTIASAGPSR